TTCSKKRTTSTKPRSTMNWRQAVPSSASGVGAPDGAGAPGTRPSPTVRELGAEGRPDRRADALPAEPRVDREADEIPARIESARLVIDLAVGDRRVLLGAGDDADARGA